MEVLAHLQKWMIRSKNPVMKQTAKESIAWSKRQIDIYTKQL